MKIQFFFTTKTNHKFAHQIGVRLKVGNREFPGLYQELNVNDGRTVLKHESELFPGKPWFYTAQIKLRIVE